jgi:hypothetical protein
VYSSFGRPKDVPPAPPPPRPSPTPNCDFDLHPSKDIEAAHCDALTPNKQVFAGIASSSKGCRIIPEKSSCEVKVSGQVYDATVAKNFTTSSASCTVEYIAYPGPDGIAGTYTFTMTLAFDEENVTKESSGDVICK